MSDAAQKRKEEAHRHAQASKAGENLVAGRKGKSGRAKNGKKLSPALYARREWDFAIQRSTRAVMVWRFLALALALALVITLFWAGRSITQPKLLPYVVQINQQGEADFRGVVEDGPVEVQDAMVRHYIIRMVESMRRISSDIVVLKRELSSVYDITTPSAQTRVTDMIRTETPIESAQEGITRDVRFDLFEKVAERTWRAEWTEITREEGAVVRQTVQTGTFTYIQKMPETEVAAEKNPLGIYFDSFFFQERRSS